MKVASENMPMVYATHLFLPQIAQVLRAKITNKGVRYMIRLNGEHNVNTIPSAKLNPRTRATIQAKHKIQSNSVLAGTEIRLTTDICIYSLTC